MTWTPSIKLYASNGTSLIYTFAYVLDLPDWPKDEPGSVELSNLRGAGSIIIPGGNLAYDFRVKGILRAADYQALIADMKSMNSTIVSNTPYVLSINLTPSTYDTTKVKRVSPIVWEGPERKTTHQYYTVTFRALSW